MKKYTVLSGQNIYDVALTLYGSVEGVFDLLASNEWLSMETVLEYGMELSYHEEFLINESVATWIRKNGVKVKNGEYMHAKIDVESSVKEHIEQFHPEIVSAMEELTPDERNFYWEEIASPAITIAQSGTAVSLRASMKGATHMFIDWGDYTDLVIVEGGNESLVEHCYKGSGSHTIVLYGDFECYSLDLSDIGGPHYPNKTIFADTFKGAVDSPELNQLIVTEQ